MFASNGDMTEPWLVPSSEIVSTFPYNTPDTKAKQAKQSKKEAFDTAYNALCLGGDAPTVQDMIEYYTEQNEDGEVQKPTSRTVYRWIKDYGYSLDKNSGKILNDTTCDMT